MNIDRPASFVGELTGIDNTYGRIKSYDEATRMFTVQRLAFDTIQVPLAEIKPFYPSDFRKRYPAAPTIRGSYQMTEFPTGSEVDCTHMQKTPQSSHTIAVKGPCHVKGTPDKNPRHLHSLVASSILVEPENSNCLVEFDDLLFIYPHGVDMNRTVTCARGGVIFTRCTFGGSAIGLIVGLNDPNVHVYLIRCRFLGNAECSVLVNTGRVTMIDCQLRDGNLCVRKGGCLQVHVSILQSSALHVVGGKLTVLFSGINDSSNHAVTASSGAKVVLIGCHIFNSKGSCIAIQGSKVSTTAQIVSTVINNAPSAVCTRGGKVDVQINNVRVFGCPLGLYIVEDTIGRVIEKDGVYQNCQVNRLNLSGDKCNVRIDGELQPQGTQRAELDRNRELITRTASLRTPTTSLSKIVLKNAGFIDVSCSECHAVSPENIMFKKCSECREARYCSRACQKAHWSKHKAECTVYKLRALTLSTIGYIHCAKCRAAEADPTKPVYSACSGCLKLFYCSKSCQKAHWKEHKVRCKRGLHDT